MNNSIIFNRYADIADDRVTYTEYRPYKQQSKIHFKPRYVDSRYCRSLLLKRLCAALWRYLGVKL